MVRALALAFFVWPARAGVIVWEDGSGGRHEHGAAVSYEAFCEGLLEAVERGTRPLTLVETPVFAEAWAEARRKRLRPRGRRRFRRASAHASANTGVSTRVSGRVPRSTASRRPSQNAS